MSTLELSEIVDLDRYPLTEPGSDAYHQLLEAGREKLESEALFALRGFLRPGAVATMATELEKMAPQAVRFDAERVAYEEPDPSMPADHPRNRPHRTAYRQVLNHQIPNDSALRAVFLWQPLAEFLRQVCGYETLHRSECPHLGLTAKIAGPGDTDGWHFDGNDVVFSLLLQAAEVGGDFEYAPFVRTRDDEAPEAVAAVFDDPGNRARRPGIGVGDLTVFKGDLSVHRVTPVEGPRKRIVALFSYDERPGMVFPASYIRELCAGLPDKSAA